MEETHQSAKVRAAALISQMFTEALFFFIFQGVKRTGTPVVTSDKRQCVRSDDDAEHAEIRVQANDSESATHLATGESSGLSSSLFVPSEISPVGVLQTRSNARLNLMRFGRLQTKLPPPGGLPTYNAVV
jgi:hypothetical protein